MELFSIRIQRTFQLVSTVYSIFYIYILTMDGEIIMRPIILKRITTEIKHN